MKGYIVNTTGVWTHAMKKSVGPGGKIYLNDLYKQYGVQYGIAEGEEFVSWLKSVKLKGKSGWELVYDQGASVESEEEDLKPEIKTVPNTDDHFGDHVKSRIDKKHIDVSSIVGLSVRKAREVIPKIDDVKLLRYALEESKCLSDKDTLCMLLRRRIKDLEIHR